MHSSLVNYPSRQRAGVAGSPLADAVLVIAPETAPCAVRAAVPAVRGLPLSVRQLPVRNGVSSSVLQTGPSGGRGACVASTNSRGAASRNICICMLHISIYHNIYIC